MILFGVGLAPLAAALLFHGRTIEAYPNGAGGCDEGDLLNNSPAAALHRNKADVITGSLADGGFEVSVDGMELTPGAAINITAVIPHKIVLNATGDKMFRGFLIRVSDPAGEVDTLETIGGVPTNTNIQVADVCTTAGFGSVTHTERDNKTDIAALMITELADDTPSIPLTLDITMVVSNRDDTAEHYYSQFTVNSITPPSIFDPCPVCGNGALTIPEKEIELPKFPPSLTTPVTLSCGQLDQFTSIGFVADDLCPMFQKLVGEACGCTGGGDPPTPPGTPTMAPEPGTPTMGPDPQTTMAPTTSAGAIVGLHAAAVAMGVGAAVLV